MEATSLTYLAVLFVTNLLDIAYSGRVTDADPKKINIGVILPVEGRYPWGMNKTAPAIQFAIENVQKNEDILPGYKFNIMYGDSECSETFGPLRAIDMHYKHSVHLFLGPVCDFSVSPIAKFSQHWNIPVITAGGLVQHFQNKTQYKLLTRMSGSYDKLGGFFVNIFKEFNWYTPAVIYHDNPKERSTCYFTMTSVHLALKMHYHQFYKDGKIWNKAIDENLKETYDAGSILNEASKHARIIVMCASDDTIREFLIKAVEMGFDNGEYVFINIDLFQSKKQNVVPWKKDGDSKERNEKARKGYSALLTVTLHKPDSEEYTKFSEEVKKRANEQYGNKTYGEEQVNNFVEAFHDAVVIYALALNESLASGNDPSNGTEIIRYMWNTSFQGITGTVSIDENGDRNMDYSLLDLDSKSGNYEIVANYYGNRKKYEAVKDKKIHWPGGWDGPPPDVPKCGFDGSLCAPFPKYALAIILLSSLIPIVTISAILMQRRSSKKWKQAAIAKLIVDWNEISFDMDLKKSGKFGSRMSLRGEIMGDHRIDLGNKQLFAKTGHYQGELVAIKEFNKPHISSTSSHLIQDFTKMIDIHNNNLIRFMGACLETPHQCILTEYCSRGSLQDVLENDQMKLESVFKSSLIQDIITGMAYLHGSGIPSHGNLKSSNCLVDSHFQLKITDFGLHSLRKNTVFDEEEPYQYYRNKLWTAPEILRMHEPPIEGTQKGDVYSFAIICQEILYRKGPFWVENLDPSPEEIHGKVKDGQKPYFRPFIDTEKTETIIKCNELALITEEKDPKEDEKIPEALVNMVRQCWAEDPKARPDFRTLEGTIHTISGDTGDILENLMARMELYAEDLEKQVQARTADYIEETKRVENVLHLLLPKSVAKELMGGGRVTPKAYDSVTLYFSDVKGFTALCAESKPEEVVQLLKQLYKAFDSIADELDVYKVETIGDAYMVASGLPDTNGVRHAREISRMSLGILEAVRCFKVEHKPGYQLQIRIGIHTGPVLSGVVGDKMPRYCLFGQTVLTASGMESSGEAMKIQISPTTKALLDIFGTFEIERRDPEELLQKNKDLYDMFKSHGTYWLLGEKKKENLNEGKTLFDTL